MVTYPYFVGLVALFGIERLVELKLSKAHAARALSRGGVEFGRGHYPPMVALHSAFLLACVIEPWLFGRQFVPQLGWAMLALALAAQGIRWWAIASLGDRWNTRVIVVPGTDRKRTGPYQFLNHPNYVAVVLEGFALPLVHNAWVTAIAFTTLNAFLLWVRVQCENRALSWAEEQRSPS